jgi:hypothetical protein
MEATAIFLLQPILDNPQFEGFGSGDSPSVLGRENLRSDFFPAKPIKGGNWNWKLEPLTPHWKTPEVLGRVTPFNDFPCLGMLIPAFSGRAVSVLRDFLEPNGEILPLSYKGRTYYAFNCLTIVEILNHLETVGAFSHGNYSPKKGLFATATSISYMSVIPERTEGLSIFRMRELTTDVFVTNEFVKRVNEHGLNGFDFMKVWPMPKGTNYLIEHLKKAKEERSQKIVPTQLGLREVKAQSLVIAFPLAISKILKEEKKLLSQYQNELDAQLSVRSLDENYFGCLEERRTRKGVCQLFLSCPDSQLLFKKLEPWFECLSWPLPVKVYLRSKPYHDYAVDGIEVQVGEQL